MPHLSLHETCGLGHERQVIAVPAPPGAAALSFRDKVSGVELPAQRSRENPALAFLQLELPADARLELIAQEKPAPASQPVTLAEQNGHALVSNGKWTAEIYLGEWTAESGQAAPTPLQRWRVGDGPWRGRCFFDTRHPVQQVASSVVESGPLRVVTKYEARIGSSGSYTARLTFDAGSDFIVIDEQFHGDSGDQIVWDFSGDDLPEKIHLLDSTANFATQNLHYFFDRRLARLACWNQYSQLHDFSDGYALKFPHSRDVAGFVALRGGDWDGNSHNFLEAWTRRWLPGDPSSRRLVPPEAKADAAPSPERIAARPANQCEAHFSIEGWLHRGRRIFALVLAEETSLRSTEWNLTPPLGHFEEKPDRARYRQQQSLLRRIHTQHGLFSLQDQLATPAAWPVEEPPAHIASGLPPWENPDHIPFGPTGNCSPVERVDRILEFLSARVFGFWEGSGSAYTNAVVNRRLAEDLLAWEWLSANGHVRAEQNERARAWFVFLARILSSENYYPGAALMSLQSATKQMEPTIAGMANQNFFTDVFNFPGIAAQVFHAHPESASWRERFGRMWRRQLEYHVYPQSGVWEESHTYFHHVLQTVLPTLERRRDDGVEDGFTDSSFQRAVASLLKMLTPRDACFGNERHVVALGDHGVDPHNLYRPLYRILAQHIRASNPDLAARLSWAYREMGGMDAVTVTPSPIEWRNEQVEGLGYFFRSRDEGGESLIVLRCGSAWAHHHQDDGSLQFFHAGRAWIVDSAFSYPQENGVRKIRADGHSRWAARDLHPLNHLWQFNRGWITQHRGEGPLAYAVAHTPIYMAETNYHEPIPLRWPILHQRCVVQLAPSAFLVLDHTDISLPQVTRFHVPNDAAVVLEDSEAPAIDHGPYLRLRSLFGLGAAQTPATDRPTHAGERYATREICFPSKDEKLSGLLILVESPGPGSAVSVAREGGSVSITHPKWSVALDNVAPDQVLIRDLKSPQQISFPADSTR